MRIAIAILLGLAIGVIGTAMTLNALRQASAFPRGVMAVMQHHLGSLRQATRDGRCDAGDSQRRLQSLRMLAEDIAPAFPGIDDPVFRDYTASLIRQIDGSLAAVPDDCSALEAVVSDIGSRCSACHRDYR
ncbi:MAG: cytochrome C [Rehaibacterium terrae]|uniref:cytochrome C n=1 Tax=Rehaibacterium terrae TaxID=1341696 RepID=UPI00391DA271